MENRNVNMNFYFIFNQLKTKLLISMKRNLLVRSFYGLLLILLVSVVIVSCIHDEREAVSSNNSINISQDITTKAYTKLSPWSEDVDFIQKVQKVFLKNAKLDYFRDKYGDIYWDYALSFPNKLEAGLALPIIKDNNVVMLLKATEKNGRIYFQKIENGEYIDFFRNLILQDKSLQTYTNGVENGLRKVAGIDKMATMEYKCTYKTVSIGCPNGQSNCPPVSRTVSECSWIETGGQDFESIAPPDESGGGGGDGGYTDNQLSPDPTLNPCYRMKLQKDAEDFKGSLNDLKSKTGLKKETGYTQNAGDNKYTYQDNASATNDANSLNLPDAKQNNIKSYMHTHVDNYTYTDADGNEIIRTGIKMFSPADVAYFMDMLQNAKDRGASFADVSGTMVTSSGTYTIRFTGNEYQIKTFTDAQVSNYREAYKTFMTENSNTSLEQKFLQYIDTKMNVKGVELFKLNDNGTTTKMALNSDKSSVNSSDCP